MGANRLKLTAHGRRDDVQENKPSLLALIEEERGFCVCSLRPCPRGFEKRREAAADA